MTPQVRRSEDGYTLSGLEPPSMYPGGGLIFYRFVTEFGLKEKDRDLAKGLDKDGKPLKPISPYTRKHRRSAMTPSGKGDPDAPPLIPGWQKSRTRSLLKGKAFNDRAEFWWAFDAFTGDSWATILEAQKKKGRDVFGLSPAAIERVRKAAWKRWEAYNAGRYTPKDVGTELAPPVRDRINTPPITKDAIGLTGPVKDRTGFMTRQQFREFYRQTAPATLPGRPRIPKEKSPISGPGYNVILQHVHQKRILPPTPKPIKVKPPKPKPVDVGAAYDAMKALIAGWFS